MNQDIVFQAVVFGGLYAIAFFIVYLFGRQKSPSLALQFTVSSWLGLMLIVLLDQGASSALLFVILFLASFFIFRGSKVEDTSFKQFFTDNHIYKASVVPEQVSNLLGSQYYSCANGTITAQSGQKIRFTWWQGMSSAMIKSGNAYVNTFTYYLAISFAPGAVSEAFKQVARAKPDTSGLTFRQKIRRFFVLDTRTPIRVDETPDGSFVIIWQTYDDLKHYAYYLTWLRENVAGTEPVETNSESTRVPTITPESTPPPIIQSSRQQHGQALGQMPNPQLHSRY